MNHGTEGEMLQMFRPFTVFCLEKQSPPKNGARRLPSTTSRLIIMGQVYIFNNFKILANGGFLQTIELVYMQRHK